MNQFLSETELDRGKTQFQETGRLYVGYLSLAQIVGICNDLGIDLADTQVYPDGYLRVVNERSVT